MNKVIFAGLWILLGAIATAQVSPVITVQPSDQAAVIGSNAIFSVAVSGTGPFDLQWRLNGVNIPARIVTFAGNGIGTYSGDGGPAVNASLFYPSGVALDRFGGLLIADSVNNRVRMVDTNGIITTIAGNGAADYYGDSGPATNAAMNSPYGIAMDGSGNLYIADLGNNVIRRMGNDGVISTIAGSENGTAGNGLGDGGAATNAVLSAPYGVAADGAGNVFIADTENQRIRRVGADGIITTVVGGGFGRDGILATNASLNTPIGVSTDGHGNLFIADTYNHRIRQVATAGQITTVAGNVRGNSGNGGPATNAGLNFPFCAALDRFNNLLIADTGNNLIHAVGTNGVITTIAGSGAQAFGGDGAAAVSAALSSPAAVVGDQAGNIYIADTYNHRIRKIPAAGPTLTLSNLTAGMAGSYDVVVTGFYGNVTSSVASLTVLFPPSITQQPLSAPAVVGAPATINESTAGTLPLFYQWYFNGVTVTGQTNSGLNLAVMSVTNVGSYYVVITNLYGSVTSAFATLEPVYAPTAIIYTTNREVLLGGTARFTASVTGTGPFTYQWRLNGTDLPGIITVAGNGQLFGDAGDGGPATNAGIRLPYGLTIDGRGALFIADPFGNRIRRVSPDGVITTVAGNGLAGYSGDGGAATNANLREPLGVVAGQFGDLLIADTLNGRIRRIDTNGLITTIVGNGSYGYSGDGGPATNAAMHGSAGLAIDAVGNVFIGESNGFRIHKVDTHGIITTVAGNGTAGFSGDGGPATNASLRSPTGVAVDGSGILFIAEYGNARVRKVDTNGIMTTLAGVGGPGYSGDGGFATNATLNQPYEVALDMSGNVYITDSRNDRIRRVDPRGFITTIAGNGVRGYAGDGGAALSASLARPTGLAVDVSGNLFFSDSYDYRVREVIAQGPKLTVTNVNAGSAGNYDVVVTSPFGSFTSAIVALSIVLPALQPGLNMNNRILRFKGLPAQSYVLQAVPSLVAPVNWQPIFTNTANVDGSWMFTAPVLQEDSKIFYRVTIP